MRDHATQSRARIALGVTIPVEGIFGGLRVDVAFEDYLRPEDSGSTKALRKRVARTARADLRSAVLTQLKKYRLDNAGRPRRKPIRWA